MKIAINLNILLSHPDRNRIKEVINYLQEQGNKVFVFVNGDELFIESSLENAGKRISAIRQEVINWLEENEVSFQEVICCDRKSNQKIQNILNIGALIEDALIPVEDLNESIDVYSFRTDQDDINDRRYYVDSVEELEQLLISSIERKKADLASFSSNDFGKPSIDRRWVGTYSIDQANVNIPKMNVHDYVYFNNYSNMDALALRYFGKKITFEELFNKRIEEFAKSLKTSGVKQGDIVTIMMPNTPEGVIAFLAVNKIGAIACMLHPLLKGEDVLDTLNKTNSRYMVMCDTCYPEISKIEDKSNLEKIVVVSPADSMPIRKGLPKGIKLLYLAKEKFGRLQKRINCFRLQMAKMLLSPQYPSLLTQINKSIEETNLQLKSIPYGTKYIKWKDELINGEDYQEEIESIYEPDQIAVLLRTGGTSGHAKLAALTNENIVSNTSQLRDTIPSYQKGDELLAISPIFHGFGLVDSVITALAVNMSVDLHPQYNKAIFIKSVIENKPVLILGVPTLWKSLIHDKRFDGHDLSYAKVWISGGDTLAEDLKKEINEWRRAHNAVDPIYSGIGMTEATAAIAFTGLKSTEIGSVGYPLPLNDIKIINPETGVELGYETPGELCISGPTVMHEYYKNPEETEKALRMEDGKVWLHTGDICILHQNGEITYQDRDDNIIIVSGVNVYSNKIEAIISRIPEVESCAVVACPHQYKMNVPMAYIVLKKGFVLDEELKNKILCKCNKELDTYSRLYDIVQIDALPLTPLNKVNKKVLREMLKEEQPKEKILKEK